MTSHRIKDTIHALVLSVPGQHLEAMHVANEVVARLHAMFPGSVAAKSVTALFRPEDCTRARLLSALKHWVEAGKKLPRSQPQLLYVHSHGGRASFDDQPGDLAEEVSYYICCLGHTPDSSSALLDVELSARLTELADCSENLSVIVDACHSGGQVRTDAELGAHPHLPVARLGSTPAWVRAVFEEVEHSSPLAAISHPGIMRLTSSSPARQSYAVGGMGRFTRQLLDCIDELDQRWPRMTWTMLGSLIRDRLIRARGRNEDQWISLAGPGDRMLFSSTRSRPPRAVGLVTHRLGRQWIRAGALAGVEVGDLWAPLETLVSGQAEPRFAAMAERRICEVPALDHSDVGVTSAAEAELAPILRPCLASLQKAATRMRVELPAELESELKLGASVWLRPGGPDADEHVRRLGGELVLAGRQGRWPEVRVADRPEGRVEVRDLLEDRARARRLEALSSRPAPGRARPLIEWRVGVDDSELRHDARASWAVEPGQRLWLKFRNAAWEPPPGEEQPTWFVAAVLIDVIGRPWLLSSSQPEGIELGPGERERIGRRRGARASGFAIEWPKQAVPPRPSPGEHRLRLLLSFTRWRVALAHLTHACDGSDAMRVQGFAEPLVGRTFGSEQPPDLDLDRAWGYESVELGLGAS